MALAPSSQTTSCKTQEKPHRDAVTVHSSISAIPVPENEYPIMMIGPRSGD
jgi:hypothetical protein